MDPGVVYASTKHALARWVRHAGGGLGRRRDPAQRRRYRDHPHVDDGAAARRRPGGTYLVNAVPMPLGGIAEPGAVATVLAFLTSEKLQSVTGQVLFVDGGADCVTRGDDVFSIG